MSVTTTRRLSQGKTYAVIKSGSGDTTLAKSAGVRRVPNSTQNGAAVYPDDGNALIDETANYDVTDGAVYPQGPVPQSIIDAATAAARRILAAVAADNGAPSTDAHGKALRNVRLVNLLAKVSANTAAIAVYLYSSTSGDWYLDTITMALDAATDGGRGVKVAVDVGRFDRIYLRATGMSGVGTVDAWVELLED